MDWLIVAFASILAFLGSRQGFIVGALSFCGFVLGAFLGTRLAPHVLPQGSSSPYAPAFGLLGALLGGAILASGLEGLGFRLRRFLIVPGMGLLDGALGAALGAALALGIVWIGAAAAGQTPGQDQLRADIQRSAILRRLNQVLPPSGSVLDALHRRFGARQLHELREAQTALRYRGIKGIGRLARRQRIQEPFDARVERHGSVRVTSKELARPWSRPAISAGPSRDLRIEPP